MSDKENTIKISVSAQLNTWIGVGYGESMTNTDMNIIELINGTDYKLHDSYSIGFELPKDDTEMGGTFDLENISFSAFPNQTGLITFERKLITGDKLDAEINPDIQSSFIFAWGKGRLAYHGSNNHKTISSNIDEDDNKPEEGFNFFKYHGIIMKVLWTAFNFIGYVSARFYKHYSWWLWVHRIGSASSGVISIGALSASVIYASDFSSESPAELKLHKTFGIILFVFIVIQTLLGIINYLYIYTKSVNSGFIHKFKIVHKCVGIFLTFSVYVNIISGFLIQWPNLVPIPFVFGALCLGTIIIFEIIHIANNNFRKVELINESVRDNLSHQPLSHSELNTSKMSSKWVLYENFICDVTKFAEYHPGGHNLLNDNLFQDVGRYMTGTQAYSRNFLPHSHNYATQDHLISKLAFAQLKDERFLFIKPKYKNSIEDIQILRCNNSEIKTGLTSLTLIEKIPVAQNVCEFRFRLNSEIKFVRLHPDVYWIGRHFSVSSPKLNITRYYSLSLCLNREIREKHEKLIRSIGKIHNGEMEIDNSSFHKEELNQDYFSIFVKDYKKGLSSHIHNMQLNSVVDLIIRGPNGIGLNIFDNKLYGNHVIFAAGTGIIPFIDLIFFTLRYVVYKINNDRDNCLLKDENFDYIVSSTYKLNLYATFTNTSSGICLDVLKEMDAISHKYNLNLFKLNLRISDADETKWDDDFIVKEMESIKKQITRVYIVGPVGFMHDIKNGFIRNNIVEEDKISLV